MFGGVGERTFGLWQTYVFIFIFFFFHNCKILRRIVPIHQKVYKLPYVSQDVHNS